MVDEYRRFKPSAVTAFRNQKLAIFFKDFGSVYSKGFHRTMILLCDDDYYSRYEIHYMSIQFDVSLLFILNGF